MKKLSIAGLSAAAYGLFSSTAFAASCLTNPNQPQCQGTAVPEISAMEGTAALVALAAIVLLTFERRRRAQ